MKWRVRSAGVMGAINTALLPCRQQWHFNCLKEMRYRRDLSVPDAAWIQFRKISSLLSNFVYRRRWYARRARGHINPHKVSEEYHNQIGELSDRATKFYSYLCRTDPYDTSFTRIEEEVIRFRADLLKLKQSEFDEADFPKFRSTWKKIDDELKIIEGHINE